MTPVNVNPMNDWFDPIYQQHREQLLRIANHLVYDPELAEDIVQIVFLKMLTKYTELREHPNIKGWLIKAVHYQAMSEAQKAYHDNELPFAQGFEPSTEDSYQSDFFSILPPGLSESDREILYLRIEAGFSYEVMSGKLGISPDACCMRYLRAKKHCQKIFEKISDDALDFEDPNKFKDQEV